MAKSYFKQEHDLEKRIADAAKTRNKHPDRIPVIVEKAERSDIPSINEKKWYAVRANMTVKQFARVILKKINSSAEKAIFIFVDNDLLPTEATMSAIYDEKKDEDGFLYVTYSGENTSPNVMDPIRSIGAGDRNQHPHQQPPLVYSRRKKQKTQD